MRPMDQCDHRAFVVFTDIVDGQLGFLDRSKTVRRNGGGGLYDQEIVVVGGSGGATGRGYVRQSVDNLLFKQM